MPEYSYKEIPEIYINQLLFQWVLLKFKKNCIIFYEKFENLAMSIN